MSIFEYNVRLHEETLKKEGFEEGFERGRIEGRIEGRAEELKRILQNAFKKGYTPKQITDFNGMDLNEVLRIQKQLHPEDTSASSDEYLG